MGPTIYQKYLIDQPAKKFNRLESDDGFNKATEANLRLIRETLQAAGIEFVGDADEGPGVRLWSKPDLS